MIPRRKCRFYKGEWKDILFLLIKGQIAKGKFIKKFEREFARYIGAKFAVSTCSGRRAFDVLLDALDLSPADEIIFPADILTDLLILTEKRGLVYRLADINKDSFNIEPGLLESKITPKTKAIVVAHRFGYPADLERIMKIAKKHNLYIIEDCAQSLGSGYKDGKVGLHGDFGIFVFSCDKAINTFGGSVIVTNNNDISTSLMNRVTKDSFACGRLIFNIFIRCCEEIIVRGPFYVFFRKLSLPWLAGKEFNRAVTRFHDNLRLRNSRFTNLQSLLGFRQLQKLDQRNRQRGLSARKMAEILPAYCRLQGDISYRKRIFNHFIVVIEKERVNLGALKTRMLYNNIDVAIKGEIIMDNRILKNKQINDFPGVQYVIERSVQLPLYDGIRGRDIKHIIASFSKCL